MSAYRPEFAQQGKGDVTVRQLLSHRAGLCVIDERLDTGKPADLDAPADILAARKPAWPPGTRHGYHTISLGWYEGELLRKVDPDRRSMGRFFREEIAARLGIEFHIGTPPEVPESRVARVKDTTPVETLVRFREIPQDVWPLVRALASPWSLSARSFFNPGIRRFGDFASPCYRVVEILSANGIGRVGGIAKAHGVFATGGRELGITDRTMEELTAPPSPPESGWRDEVLKVDARYSLGFEKPGPGNRFDTGERAFGNTGAGGPFAFADPDVRLGYAYAMTRMGFCFNNDQREKALRYALYDCPGEKQRQEDGSPLVGRPEPDSGQGPHGGTGYPVSQERVLAPGGEGGRPGRRESGRQKSACSV